MVGVSGLLAVLGSQLVGYPGAGPLGCIVGAFVAGCGWRAFSPAASYVSHTHINKKTISFI